MTQVVKYIDDPQGTELVRWEPHYTKVLDMGFIGLVDFMGDDGAVVDAARVSYGKGTVATSSDRGLLRYLMKHQHTTPFEMVEFKFHVKAPIFVFRQWHRHRTASINEMSGRYSVLDNEMYVPNHDHTSPQAVDNKQGRKVDLLEPEDYNAIRTALDHAYTESYQTYLYISGPSDGKQIDPPDAINQRRLAIEEMALGSIAHMRDLQLKMDESERIVIDEDFVESAIRDWMIQSNTHVVGNEFPGIARELARMVLPVATYSQMYWKANLKNIFNFIALRSDPHAQYEIRVYSDAMLEMVRQYAPMCVEAFEDYWAGGASLSRMEIEVLQLILSGVIDGNDRPMIEQEMADRGCTTREIADFYKRF